MTRRWHLPAALVLLAGCTAPQTRLQSEDDTDRGREVATAEVKTIGDLTEVSNVNAIPVVGIGLVTQLDGTGGGVPPGPEATTLSEVLRKRGCENVKELFNSKTTSLVRIVATVPAGSKKGDPIDVFLSVPENSRTTSLRGGKLEECLLYNFDSTGRISAVLNPGANRGDALIRGHALVKCEGNVIAGVGSAEADGDEPPSLKRGVVWGGGKSLMPDWQFFLTLNPDQQYARVAMRIAERINDTFHAPSMGAGSGEIASAKSKSVVYLSVPGAYRLNMARFLRVARLVPLNEAPPADSEYAHKLGRQLLDPATTITAALRLEALGIQSLPALKVGLNSDIPLVRFASAEALAYLGSPSCGEELGKQVVEQPFVQAFALTALASLNEAICRVKLQELLSAPNPETRFGAFRALRARDDRDPLVAGEVCGTFTVHHVARGSAPQVHLATTKKPEVVLFGDGPALVAPLTLVVGPEFTLRAEEGKSTVVVSRFTTYKGKQTKECPPEIGEVLKTVAALGGNFADAAELLRQADASRGLNCALKVDAMPKAPTVYDLARAGAKLAGSTGEGLSAVAAEIGVTPTLYEPPTVPKPAGQTGAE